MSTNTTDLLAECKQQGSHIHWRLHVRGGGEERREWKIPVIRWLLAYDVYLSRNSDYRWHLLPALSFLCDGDLLPGLCVCGPITCGWRGESRGNQPWYIDTTTHPWSNTSLQSRATAMTQSTIKRGPSDTLVCKKCTRVEARELSSISADSWSLRLSPNCPAHHSAHTLQRKKRGCVLMVMPDTHVQAPCNRATHVD